jgi:hypothetical protein
MLLIQAKKCHALESILDEQTSKISGEIFSLSKDVR